MKTRFGRFLGTFTAFTQPISSYVTQGINESNIAYTRAVVPSAMSPGDTLQISIPPGQDPGLVPAELYFPSITPITATGTVNYTAGVKMVSHNTASGMTIVSAISGISAGDEILLEYIGGM